MKKLNTSPISGMQEFLPATQATFTNLKNQIERVFHLHGFQRIETPIIDRTEILLAKAGGDTEKQIYKVVKTAETSAEADQALRFDNTVPLARYIVEHESSLSFPFRVTQTGRNFRGERPQKGRFREFYQCDVDVIGRGQLPLAYDAEVIATLYAALSAIQLPSAVARLSNRKILTGLIDSLQLTQFSAAIFNIIDHIEKVPAATTRESLAALGLTEPQIDLILQLTTISGPAATVSTQLAALSIDNPTFAAGCSELTAVLTLLEHKGLGAHAVADLRIVRGLDYYTGNVFEFILPESRAIGSICGGGRYANLASHYTDQSFPGVGGSIGLSRLFYAITENHLIPDSTPTPPIDFALLPVSDQDFPAAFQLADQLRSANFSVDPILTDKKLGDKFAHAAKNAAYAIVVGANEAASGQYSVKNLATGQQLPLTDFLSNIQ